MLDKNALKPGTLSRRQLLRQATLLGLALPLFRHSSFPLVGVNEAQPPDQANANSPSVFAPEDEQLLDELEKANFLYFWEQANPQTGLVKDRSNARSASDTSIVASIAATGFGLTALCIGQRRNFISPGEARERALAALRFLWKKLPTHRGFFYHFANINTGDGHNRVAILDPNATENDPVIPTTQVMQEVITQLGVTPDPDFPTFPGAVREWCINAAAVDPFTKSVMVNSEDGRLYRWDLTSNTLSEVIKLSGGIGEAYTPTIIGADGTVYAINDAVLDAIGK